MRDHKSAREWSEQIGSQAGSVLSWFEQLQSTCPGQRIAVIVELKQGALIHLLRQIDV